MILRRLGNKQAIAKDIIKYFPEHNCYVEPFFGAGGMFFNKPKANYNILNDLDSDVFNLFQVVMNQKEELKKSFYMMPIHSDLLDYWKKNEEIEPIKKGLRFLLLSNFTLLGTGSQLSYLTSDAENAILENLEKTQSKLYGCRFNNTDFRKFLKALSFRGREKDALNTFIYCDPPYLGTNDNYSNSFKEQDSIDLFDCLQATGCKFAMSEFNNEFILNESKERGLNVIIIGERQNLKNRRIEILVTNYETSQLSLFN
jgi:DNA adenine methylase